MGQFKVNRKDIFFILKDQLDYGSLCSLDRYSDLDEKALDMLVNEAVHFARGVVDPLNEIGEEQGVIFENGRVTCPPAFKKAFKQYGRDGWIAAHNSYLESIYRAGLVSVLLILAMVIQLMRITIHFIKLASYKGLLLCGILVNWMMAANFLLIFALPYTAIPVWGLFGVVFAYYKDSLKELPCAY